MLLIKRKDGSYFPSDEESIDFSRTIKVGTEISAKVARNPKFHRKGMALLNLGFENQDTYKSFEVYRKVITIKAGFFDLGELNDFEIPLAHSISFLEMGAEKFEKWYNATIEVISKDMGTAPEKVRNELDGFY